MRLRGEGGHIEGLQVLRGRPILYVYGCEEQVR